MTKNRWMKVACAAVVTSVGCTESTLDPSVDIQVTGKVLRQDKKPVANTLLKIDRSGNSSCVFDIFGANWKSVKTDAEGNFSLQLLGADTQNGSLARCFSLRSPAGENGRTVEAEFIVQTETVQVPTLQEWSGAPTALASATGVAVSFQPLSATQEGVSAGHSLSVRSKSAGGIWSFGQVQSPVQVSDHYLEDVADLEADLYAVRTVEAGGTKFTLRYAGDAVDLPRRGLIPISRGASCTYPGSSTSCPLTDGNLSSQVYFQESTRDVVIQLAQPKVLRKALLRGFRTAFSVTELTFEGSTDGNTWMPLANLKDRQDSNFIELELNNPVPLSHVRIHAIATDTSFRISELSEVSLFE
ncbi:discoidin domain-containing protein [Archangium lipolyticum]|uniref:discoidin domain-containing protein n=1 Tax=Archangium lipolyticum TaxID=2970465 RepID=UPI0021499FED|nr:discoidin domain-containing protein [Archangium lipolyticum]